MDEERRHWMKPNWTLLPLHILSKIGERLESFDDHLRFRYAEKFSFLAIHNESPDIFRAGDDDNRGKLVGWKEGNEELTVLDVDVHDVVDVIYHDNKFYAQCLSGPTLGFDAKTLEIVQVTHKKDSLLYDTLRTSQTGFVQADFILLTKDFADEITGLLLGGLFRISVKLSFVK
ncbi:hypothetical protein Pint_28610 [Pistacia integerrima]|uniref:Uncharacterized protein n=1 Tax=Pistacia integerrima TaxID=434235 RepID=A0ACC0YUU8_9ROSI|nr:hypothetical protein Pint_28610 [Pistacia integerrima]